MPRFLFHFLIFFLALTGAIKESQAQKPSEILLGAVYNLKGYQANLDGPSWRGAQLAATQMNREGGVLGKKLRLVLAKGESQSDPLAKKTAELIRKHPNVGALFGLSDTDMVLAAGRVVAEQRRLFVTSGATSPKLPQEIPTYLFLACFGDNVQAAAAAQWAYQKLGVRTASVLYNPSNFYTRLLQEYFQRAFRHWGGKILSVEAYDPQKVNPPAITRLKKADMIFLSAETAEEAFLLVQALRQAGFKVPILGGDGFDAPEVWAAEPKVQDVYFTTHAFIEADSPDPKVRAFAKLFKANYHEYRPDAFAALGYDTVRLLAKAIEQAGSADPGKILAAMGGIRRFEGVTGIFQFTSGDRIPTKTVTLLKIDQGKTQWVETVLPQWVPSP